MADDSGSGADAAAARAAEQARLRKERREAKIKAGGSARLNKITGLGGGIPRDLPARPESPSATAASSRQPAEPVSASPSGDKQQHRGRVDDPAEVDISEHFYTPNTTTRRPGTGIGTGAGLGARTGGDASPAIEMTDDQLRQLMLGFDPRRGGASFTPPLAGADNPFLRDMAGAGAGASDDPMMKLLSQMMAGGPGGLGGFPGSSPQGHAQAHQAQTPPPTDMYAAVWRVLHLTVALGLGLYIALFSNFTGTKAARDSTAAYYQQQLLLLQGGHRLDEEEEQRRHLFFWAFATAEAGLLTSRFFLDRARGPPSGFLWTVVSFTPPTIRAYLEAALRYSQIFSTVRSDLLVCVFVLGVFSWVRSS